MDALSSQANIAGYKAVLMAADRYARFLPMLMTAAGTVKAARVLEHQPETQRKLEDLDSVRLTIVTPIETDDLISEVLTWRVFGDLDVVWQYQDLQLYPEAWDIDVAGRVVIGGGLWVDPDYRGRDYSALFRKLLRDRELDIELSPAARTFLADHGYDPTYGARPLKRAIMRHLQDPLAKEIIQGNFERTIRAVGAELDGLAHAL